jgi:BNR repeat-like domain
VKSLLILTIVLSSFAVRHSSFAESPVPILDLPGTGTDPAAIDYAKLPRLNGTAAVVNHAVPGPHARTPDKIDLLDLRLNLHNYLAHHDGKFWCIWSDGPKVEDEPTQEIKYATSKDGVTWSEAKSVTGTPAAPYAFIARGLWVRDGELLALGAHYKGKGAFGADKELQLQAFVWDAKGGQWKFRGKLYDDAINNFAPQPLPSGDWIVTRRDSRFNVTMMIGGRKALDDWQIFPVVQIGELKGFRPDEPIFWTQPDHTLQALFRDNGGSSRLFHSTSTDQGRTWAVPALTNFPNATSKLFSIETSRGFRLLVLNANPKVARRELHLAVSEDGKTFTRLALLDVPTPPPVSESVSRINQKFRAGIASLQYPHAIEHDGRLLIALSRLKMQIEVFSVSLNDIAALLKK